MRMTRLLCVVAIATVGFAGSAHRVAADPPCPTLLSGDWTGTWASNDYAGAGGNLSGTITATGAELTGPFTLDGTTLKDGTMDLAVTCDQVAGTYTSGDNVVDVTGTLSADGKSLAANYTWSSFPDHGTFTIAIVVAPNGLAINDGAVFEGGAPPANGALARTAAAHAAPHVLQLPVTLSQPATRGADVRWQVTGGSAVAGADYVDDGTVHTLHFVKGSSERFITIPVIANSARQPDRTIAVTLSSPTKGFQLYNTSATGTIRDDD